MNFSRSASVFAEYCLDAERAAALKKQAAGAFALYWIYWSRLLVLNSIQSAVLAGHGDPLEFGIHPCRREGEYG